jgi:hypothetical protein
LKDSDLANQIDLIRFVPLTLSLEELSRVWSVFLQVHYVLSVAYRASVVLVEQQVTARPALPTRRFNLIAIPLRQPYIGGVVPQAGEGAPIIPGSSVFVVGQGLQDVVTRVDIDDATIPVTEVRATRISLTLPTNLTAGPHGIQVRHGVDIGAPGVQHLTFASNLGTFALQPIITQTAGTYNITISNVTGSGNAPRSATIDIDVAPNVGPRQTATVELLTTQGVAYTFLALPRSGSVAQLRFAISEVTAGDYLFRVRVDGAESPLELDANRIPIAPKETIP